MKNVYSRSFESAPPPRNINGSKAFTLAEVLITLGIIGVVAALTMPSLVANYQKKQTVAKLKKVYSTIAQAYEMSKNENGPSVDWIDTSTTVNTENVKKYVQTFWLPYFKSIQECSKFGDCAYNVNAQSPDGSSLSMIDNNRYSIILNDGTFIAFVPFSRDSNNQTIWAGDQKFYIDLNGPQKPNIIGKDVFLFKIINGQITSFCHNYSQANINSSCQRNGNCHCCTTKIMMDGWEIKDDYPW